MDGELRRSRRQGSLDDLGVEADHHFILVNLRTRVRKNLSSLLEQHPYALIAQVAERRRVQVRDMVVG